MNLVIHIAKVIPTSFLPNSIVYCALFSIALCSPARAVDEIQVYNAVVNTGDAARLVRKHRHSQSPAQFRPLRPSARETLTGLGGRPEPPQLRPVQHATQGVS